MLALCKCSSSYHCSGSGSCRHLDRQVPKPSSIALNSGVFEVGREIPADIVVPLPTVSGRHAMLQVGASLRLSSKISWILETFDVLLIFAEGSSVRVTDLNSTNGTYIGGKQLEPMAAMELVIGEEVTFGAHVPELGIMSRVFA